MRVVVMGKTGEESLYETHLSFHGLDSFYKSLITHAHSGSVYSHYQKLADTYLPVELFLKFFKAEQLGEESEQGWFEGLEKYPFPNPKNPKFTFIDLFAGIGGFRLALNALGGECIFSSEWNLDAQKTYYSNFGDYPFGDITKKETKACIPEKFDVLCAGFPCQAFSVAGYRKGFEDARGTLFFDVAEIIKTHRPKAVFLENVKNLKNHDDGKTYGVIRNILENELGYKVFDCVMSPDEYVDIPQNRERIFIICFDPNQIPLEQIEQFKFPTAKKATRKIEDFINYEVDDEAFFYREKVLFYDQLIATMKRSDTVYQWRRQYVRENKSNQCPTLTANMGTGGHNVPLILTPKGIRKLTPRECLNFQGYPKEYKFPEIAKSKQYMQAGNSVVVPLIKAVAEKMLTTLA